MSKKYAAWTGDIGCEGGPVLVANAEDFQRWRGAETLDPARATEIHYWSSFTPELPLEWQPNGSTGHQYLASEDAVALRESLMKTVVERWPGTVIDRDDSTWTAVRPDGRKLGAALWPDSEYDRVIRNLDTECVHVFADNRQAYFWSANPGTVRIAVDETRSFLHLAQVEFANSDDDAQSAFQHAWRDRQQPGAAGLQYRVTQGPIVVVWSPNSVNDLSGAIDLKNALPCDGGRLLDLATNDSGASLWLQPGLYETIVGWHEAGSWGVSWCTLQRVSA